VDERWVKPKTQPDADRAHKIAVGLSKTRRNDRMADGTVIIIIIIIICKLTTRTWTEVGCANESRVERRDEI